MGPPTASQPPTPPPPPGGDRRDRLCPNCSLGVMPASSYCPRCGVALPPLPPDERRVEADEQLRRARPAIWFFDLLPGLLSWRVVAATAAALAGAVLLGTMCVSIFAGHHGDMSVVFFFPFALLLGAAGVFCFAIGMSWLMCGQLCSPWEAWPDLKGRHWLVMFLVGVIGARLAVAVAYGLMGRR